jgi:hypothetical protein
MHMFTVSMFFAVFKRHNRVKFRRFSSDEGGDYNELLDRYYVSDKRPFDKKQCSRYKIDQYLFNLQRFCAAIRVECSPIKIAVS